MRFNDAELYLKTKKVAVYKNGKPSFAELPLFWYEVTISDIQENVVIEKVNVDIKYDIPDNTTSLQK